MSSFFDYVVNGRYKQLGLGMPRQEILKLLGEPNDWAGRGNFIADWCSSYQESGVWKYYKSCVGIGFSGVGEADQLYVYTAQAKTCPELFPDWPELTMGAWLQALKENNIRFQESDSKSSYDVHWVIAAETCEVHSYAPGVPKASQDIDIISKFNSVQLMRGIWRH